MGLVDYYIGSTSSGSTAKCTNDNCISVCRFNSPDSSKVCVDGRINKGGMDCVDVFANVQPISSKLVVEKSGMYSENDFQVVYNPLDSRNMQNSVPFEIKMSGEDGNITSDIIGWKGKSYIVKSLKNYSHICDGGDCNITTSQQFIMSEYENKNGIRKASKDKEIYTCDL